MANRHDWMMENHSESGKAHDFPDFLTHFRFIAMYFTVGAEGLRLHKANPSYFGSEKVSRLFSNCTPAFSQFFYRVKEEESRNQSKHGIKDAEEEIEDTGCLTDTFGGLDEE